MSPPHNWRAMSLDRLYAELNDWRPHPTPQVTIEAIMHAVRQRGVAALQEPATRERLSRCDPNALAEIKRRTTALRLVQDGR